VEAIAENLNESFHLESTQVMDDQLCILLAVICRQNVSKETMYKLLQMWF
jgi:hypothetical protein